MKKLALPGLMLAGMLVAAPLAAAQEEPAADPQIVDVKVEKACGTVTLTLTNNDTGEYGFTWTTVAGSGGSEGLKSGLIVVPEGAAVKHTVRFEEDAYGGTGALTLGVTYGLNTHKQKFVDVYPVDTDCAPPVDEPEPTETPEPSPAPSTDPEPAPSTDPEPAPSQSQSPSGGDGDFDQIGTAPVGGVETGSL